MTSAMEATELEAILQSFNVLLSGWEHMRGSLQRLLDADLVEGLTLRQLVHGVAKLKIALSASSSSTGNGGEDKEAIGTLLEALVMHMERRPAFCMTSACTTVLEIFDVRCFRIYSV